MRSISCKFWQFNCWAFQVSFVVCTDSFVDSTGASDSVLDLVRGGLVCHIYWALGSEEPLVSGLDRRSLLVFVALLR